jgi:hypothetical protein
MRAYESCFSHGKRLPIAENILPFHVGVLESDCWLHNMMTMLNIADCDLVRTNLDGLQTQGACLD